MGNQEQIGKVISLKGGWLNTKMKPNPKVIAEAPKGSIRGGPGSCSEQYLAAERRRPIRPGLSDQDDDQGEQQGITGSRDGRHIEQRAAPVDHQFSIMLQGKPVRCPLVHRCWLPV